MENNLGFIKSPKVLLLIFGILGILSIVALSISITNIDKISEESESFDAKTKDLQDRLVAVEKAVEEGPSEDDVEICYSEECNQAAKHLNKYIDYDADPCGDFYEFTCGKWMASTTLPEDANGVGTFSYLTDDIKEIIKGILNDDTVQNSAPKSVDMAKKYYKSCNDQGDLESSGKKFFNKWFESDNGLGGYPILQPKWEEKNFNLGESIAKIHHFFNEDPLLQAYVATDVKNVKKHVITIDQGSLGLLPVNYANENDVYNDLLKEYEELQVKAVILLFGGKPNDPEKIKEDVKAVIELEKTIAKIIVPPKDRRDPNKLYNESSMKKLKAAYPGFDWTKYFTTFGKEEINLNEDEKIIIAVPQYFEELEKILKNTKPRTLSNFIHWKILFQALRNGPNAYYKLYENFVQKGLGITALPKREDYCAKLVASPFTGMGGVGFAVAYDYVNQKFSNDALKEVNELVINLKDAFKEMVDESEWMDETTKVKAKAKATDIIQALGYPEWLKKDGELDKKYQKLIPKIVDKNFLNNLMEVRMFELKENIEKYNQEPDREEWPLHPAVVNAVYSPDANSITFPAGILQYPFFKSGMPAYLNFGSIGVVIGHEITHGFDDQGKEFNGDGSLSSWWTEDSKEKFEEKAQCIVDQYSEYIVEEIEMNVNGITTQGENIADNGGLKEAFRAYQQSLKPGSSSKRLPGKLSKFTPEQLFFVAYSQTWCEISSKAALENQVLSNPHSPGRFRSIGAVSNSKEFVKAFNCPEYSPMNRGKDMCNVW